MAEADPLDDLYNKGVLARPYETEYDKAKRKTELEARALNPIQVIGTAFAGGANTAVNLYNDFQRKTASGAPDPKWDPAAWLDANKARVPITQQWRWMQTNNVVEAEALLHDYDGQAHANELLAARGGFTQFTANALAGLVDVDAPLALLSGPLAGTAKAGLLSTRFGQMALQAGIGGVTGASLMAVDTSVNPTGDWTSIPTAGLLGASFGMVGGMVTPKHFAKVREDAINEFDAFVRDGTPGAKDPFESTVHTDENPYASPTPPPSAPRKPTAIPVPEEAEPVGGSTVGAAQLNPHDWKGHMADPEELDIALAAEARAKALGYDKVTDRAWDRVEEFSEPLAKMARRFEAVIKASPLVSVFDRMQQSGSRIVQMLGHDLMVSPSGISVNLKAGALIKTHYENMLRGTGIPAFADSYNAWAAGKGIGVIERNFNRDLKEEFNREVALELQARRHGGPLHPDPQVQKAADAHDAFSKAELEVYQGRPGEGTVHGWEEVKWAPGYMPQRWSGAKMARLIRDGELKRGDFEEALAGQYLRDHPGMDPADAKVYARAVISRALTRDKGMNTNLIGILQEDGTEFLREVLRNNNVSDKDITRLTDALLSSAQERSRQGQSKQRIEVDLRAPIGKGKILLDVVETDLMDSMARRARGASGRSALARKGIYSPQDRDRIINAALNEQLARRGHVASAETLGDKVDELLNDPKDVTRQELLDFFSFFSEGAAGGGVSPTVSRLMKITNLSLLNGLGLTQLAESGPMIAAFGWEKFLHYAGDSIKASLGKGDSELVKELTHMHIMAPEHRLYRDDMTHDFEKGLAQNEFWSKVDNYLNQAQRVQGYMTGYYKVKEFQQRIAVTAGADKVMRMIREGASADRLAEIGLTPALQARLKKYIDNGTIEFKPPSGTTVLREKQEYLYKLNFEKWDPKDVEDFTSMLNLIVHRQVQKTLAGESSLLFHKDGLAALFVHLKSFPLIAMTKQTLRHARIADSESLGAIFYGLMTAGAVYAAKQALNGNTDTLQDPVKLMKGAFGMSNLTGWFPMFSDPVATILGMDNLKFNQYSRGIDGNVVSMPAAFSTLSRMANIPAAVASPVTGALGLGKGVLNANDINALKATPLIGNYYGVTALLNMLKVERAKAN